MRLCLPRRIPTPLPLLAALCSLASVVGQSQPTRSELEAKAKSGDAHAQVQLGDAYSSGNGVPANDSEAVYWFRKAAEQGDASGEYSLGEMYATGRGVSKDYNQAAKWMHKAAQQGDVRALANLGALYFNGLGVQQDEKKAFELTQQAADRGFASAQFGLGKMYSSGRGVEQDLHKAIEWYSKAAAQDDAPALNNLALLLATTCDQKIRDSGKAVEFALRAVNTTQEHVPEYLDTLATAYYADSLVDKALSTEQKALALKPDNVAYQQSRDIYRDAVASAQNSSGSPPREFTCAGPTITPPKAVFAPDPEPPTKKGNNDTVVLWVVVGTDGKVHDLRVAHSVNPELDRKAMEAVRRWTFQPARKNGQPVAVQINVEVNFRLE